MNRQNQINKAENQEWVVFYHKRTKKFARLATGLTPEMTNVSVLLNQVACQNLTIEQRKRLWKGEFLRLKVDDLTKPASQTKHKFPPKKQTANSNPKTEFKWWFGMF